MKTIFLKERFLAFIIDSLFISIGLSVLYSLFNFDFLEIKKVNYFGITWKVTYSLNFLVTLVYFVVIDIFSNGNSFGKRFMKITVVNEIGEKISLNERLIRTFFKVTFLDTFFLVPILLIYYSIKNDVMYDGILKLKTIKK